MISFFLVDDNERVRALHELLIKNKYDGAFVYHATNGKEALEKANELDYSVVLSDIDMPVMNGIDFYKELKKEFPLLANRTFFISGGPSQDHLSYLEQEKLPYILKPFNEDDFYNMIDSILKEEDYKLKKEMGSVCQRKYERKEVKGKAILKLINGKIARRGSLKGEVLDFSTGGFGFQYKGKAFSGRLEAYISIESLNIKDKKAEIVWTHKMNGDVRSGFKWI